MKKLFLFVLALSVCASADSLDERVDGLQAQVDRVISKAGIHFNGEFRSQFLSSQVSGNAVDENKKNESVEFTGVDFDIVARPNTALSARAMFRLHQDWRNFFSDVQNPITTRWLSIDGALAQGIFKYSLGDYKKKLTPLTLWSPDLELLYEPEIFAQGRKYAMSEAFLGENNRVLQGANIEFKAELHPILNEVGADIFGARLAMRGTGESGVTPPAIGRESNGQYWDADFDKYLVGVNLGTQIVKGAGLAGSYITIFDNAASYRARDNSQTGTPGAPFADTVAFEDSARYYSAFTNVYALRLNFDNRAFMSDDLIRAGIQAEAALSSDKVSYFEEKNVNGVIKNIVADSAVTGTAINLGGFVRLAFGEANTLNLSVDYIQNDTLFRNDAAQSPSYIQRAIMNNENGLGGLGLMNPFDAMYRTVFKYTPSQYFGGTKPQTKNAYNNAVLTKNEIARFFAPRDNGLPPLEVFQSALPGGLASADRSGPVGKLNGSFLDRAITVGLKGAAVKTVGENIFIDSIARMGDDGFPETDDDGKTVYDIKESRYKADFLEAVGGASVDIAKFAPVLGPSMVIGFSGGMYNAKYGDAYSTESALLSFELNYNFYPRFSLLVGYQQLATTVKVGGSDAGTFTFDNLGAGLMYRVADGGDLTMKFTRLSGKSEPKGGTSVEYRAMQPEVYLTVKF